MDFVWLAGMALSAVAIYYLLALSVTTQSSSLLLGSSLENVQNVMLTLMKQVATQHHFIYGK